MENQLGSISVLQETLRDSRIGLWCIEMDDGKAPRVYVDDTFREMMDMDARYLRRRVTASGMSAFLTRIWRKSGTPLRK